MSGLEDASPEVQAICDRMMRNEAIHAHEVVAWMQSGDLELQGAAFETLTGHPLVGTVDADVANDFLFQYLVAALIAETEPPSVFGLSPYLAGHEIAGLYRRFRQKGYAPRWLARMRDELARLYISGDSRRKDVVVNGVVEHIFEEPACRGDFEGWKRHPVLGKAYSDALEWGEWYVAREREQSSKKPSGKRKRPKR